MFPSVLLWKIIWPAGLIWMLKLVEYFSEDASEEVFELKSPAGYTIDW